MDLLLAILDNNPAIIIVDGLDECGREMRDQLLSAFENIVQNSTNIVKIFISSRYELDIESYMRDPPIIQIKARDNVEDIKHFTVTKVDQAIENQTLLRGNISPTLRIGLSIPLQKEPRGCRSLSPQSLHSWI